MSQHGLTKDLNILNSINAFFDKPASPLRQQRSMDMSHQHNHSLAQKVLGHHKNITIGFQQTPITSELIK